LGLRARLETKDLTNGDVPFLDSVSGNSTQSETTLFAATGFETSKNVSHANTISGLGAGDGHSLYEGWRFGDRWA
jgi:hypothetical protein